MRQDDLTPHVKAEAPRDGGADATPAPSELQQLVDPAKQDEYRAAYLAQLRQRACPGCGEDVELF